MRTSNLAAVFLAVAVALPSAADWLVITDGSRIETEGPWRIKGSQVIFTLPGGTLSALRKTDVDLDASAVATAHAKEAAEAPAEDEETAERPRRKPVLVLTNKDLRRAEDVTAEEGEDAEGGEDGEEGEGEPGGTAPPPPPPAPPPPQVEVISWETVDNVDEGLELKGNLRNLGAGMVAELRVVVVINDENGRPIFETDAFLQTKALAPGSSTSFRAPLPGIFQLSGEPSFRVDAGGITFQGSERPASGDEDDAFDDEGEP